MTGNSNIFIILLFLYILLVYSEWEIENILYFPKISLASCQLHTKVVTVTLNKLYNGTYIHNKYSDENIVIGESNVQLFEYNGKKQTELSKVINWLTQLRNKALSKR